MADPTNPITAGSSMSASTSSLSVSKGSASFQTGDSPLMADLGRTEYGLEYLDWLERCVPMGGIVLSQDTSESLSASNSTRSVSASDSTRSVPWA